MCGGTEENLRFFSNLSTFGFEHHLILSEAVPFDVPAETVIRLTFVSNEGKPEQLIVGKTIELRVRNKDENEDGIPEGCANAHCALDYKEFIDADSAIQLYI